MEEVPEAIRVTDSPAQIESLGSELVSVIGSTSTVAPIANVPKVVIGAEGIPPPNAKPKNLSVSGVLGLLEEIGKYPVVAFIYCRTPI